jgi:hypothetical protein
MDTNETNNDTPKENEGAVAEEPQSDTSSDTSEAASTEAPAADNATDATPEAPAETPSTEGDSANGSEEKPAM